MYSSRFYSARLLLLITLSVATTLAQTTEFTYQGRLLDSSNPPTASYDFEFSLWNALTSGMQVGSTQTRTGIAVSGGVFTVKLDFGSAFTGADRFLQIAVRPSTGGAYVVLTPRQSVTSAPYSIRSANAGSSDSLTCTLCVTNAQIVSLAGNKLTGVITGDGSGISNINGAAIAAGSVTSSQLSAEAVPTTTAFKLLGSRRWDLLKPQASFPVGTLPFGIAFDGAHIWVANLSANSVSKIRASDGLNLGTFPVGSGPYDIAFDGTNIWVPNFSSNSVTKLQASDGTTLGIFPVGNNPSAVAFDGANVWVARWSSGNVTKLRATDGANLGTFAVGTEPYGLTFDGAHIWAANRLTNNVTKLRASDGANLGTFAVGTGPYDIVFDGSSIWTANRNSNNVTKLRASDGALLGTFAVGSNPEGIGFDGSNIWIANFGGDTVTKLRASDGANLGTFPVADGPIAVAFDGQNIWIANYNVNLVTRLFPAFPQP